MARPPSLTLKWRATAWLIAAAAMTAVLVFRLELSFDLSAFFPRKADLATEVLLEQLSSGPGSRMMVIGISGGEKQDRIETGRLVQARLQEHPAFVSVFNGEWELSAIEIPPPIATAYPLMTDIDYSASALRGALIERLANMAFGGGRLLRDIVARDPYFASLELLRRLAPGGATGAAWVAADGSAVVTAQTRSTGVNLQAQALAMEEVRNAFAELKTAADLQLDVTGVGAFGLELQSIIQREARILGILAGTAIFLVLLTVYRSLKLALLATVPLALGYLAGLTAVTLAFGTVHGITLAFGFTLLGVTVDYPLHLFSHARKTGGGIAIRSIWPTLRLGAASTATAYLAMVFSGSQGLSQLGLFTASGVAAAVLVTRTLLPFMLAAPEQPQQAEDAGAPAYRGFALAGTILLLATALIAWRSGGGFWNDGMDTLSPVPQARIQADQNLRSATGSADLRYQIMIESDRLDPLLVKSEEVNRRLESARKDGLVSGWSTITTLLPSREVQQRRLDAIPSPETLSKNLRSALADTAFLEAAFTPFKEILAAVPEQFPITPRSFDGGPLEVWRDAHLVHLRDHWVALYTLEGPDPDALAPLVEEWGNSVHWLDLQSSSKDLMRDFRHDAGWAIAIAGIVIALLLIVQRIGAGRLAWIALTVLAALAASICAALLIHGYLTLVHMVALLLVLGLGLDYALFLSRDDSPEGRRATIQSIVACAASTVLAFAILANSSIPLLKFIGLIVAVGAAASLACAWLGSRRTAGRETVS